MKNKKEKILIVGAGVAGRELQREIHKHLNHIYQLVGFIDDDLKKTNKKIKGTIVLGTTKNLSQTILKLKISEVFIAIPSSNGETIRKIIDSCQKVKVRFKIIPRLMEIVEGKVKLQQVRSVKIEDIVGRALLKSNQSIFRKNFKRRKILITGAAGSIGSEICRQLAGYNPSLIIALDWSENGLYDLQLELGNEHKNIEFIIANITDSQKLRSIFTKYNPDTVFHAAAYKHVPFMQEFPEEAINNNIFGTDNVAMISKEYNVKNFVYLSTDKAVDPSSVMGATKLIGEKIINNYNQESDTRYCAVRFGNVFGSVGSVVPTFIKQIAKGGPVTVTDKRMVRFFMSIPEAVQLVLQASLLSKGGEIFVLDMGDQFKIDLLAKIMIRLSGYVPGKDIKIKYTGIRPGEKLSEDLFSKKEKTIKTKVKRIYKIRKVEKMNVDGILNELKIVRENNNPKDLVNKVMQIVQKIK